MKVSGRGRGRAAAAAAALTLALAGGYRAAALDSLQLTLDAMHGSGWRTGPVSVSIALGDGGALTLQAHAGGLELPPPLARVQAVSLACAAASQEGALIECPAGRVTVHLRGASRLDLEAGISVDAGAGTVRVRVREQNLAGGRASLSLDAGGGRLQLHARFRELAAAGLGGALARAHAPVPVSVSAGSLSGEVSVRDAGVQGAVDARLQVRALAFSDDSGLRAGESLDADLELSAMRRAGGWDLRAGASLLAGALYGHPVLIQVDTEPLTLAAQGHWSAAGRLRLHEVAISDPGVAELRGALELALGPTTRLRALALELAATPLARLYPRYLRPFAGAGALSELSVQGEVSGELAIGGAGGDAARLTLADVDVGDPAGRFALLGLGGELHWSGGATAPASRLAWRGAQVYSLDFGGGALRAELAGRRARLHEPLSLQVLDGQVRIERLEGQALGQPDQRIEADVSLSPISLQRLSDRLAWLPLSGSIAGDVPRLVYTGGRLAVEGDVRMRLFDGQVTVAGLELEQPFGVVPVLRADVRVQGIDLAVLTRAFSFGSIEGRLDARVDGLVLERWQPVAFDARLHTPEGDTSRHRISQRAVDNLASLGGANAVLSTTFLRFFREFSYERLGLSCRLRAGVCEMDGVAPAPQGYYIVQGGGLPPRVDIVGFNRKVDWATLVDRLRAVASSRGPVVR